MPTQQREVEEGQKCWTGNISPVLDWLVHETTHTHRRIPRSSRRGVSA